jgi:hypothetical protein
MPDDIQSVLELKPEGPGAAPTPTPDSAARAAGSVRWSLTTFIIAAVAWLGAVLVSPFAIFPGGDFFKTNDALVVVGLLLGLAGAGCLIVSIICGLFAVRHRPVVLWWVIPSVLVIGFLGFLVISIIASLS